LLKLFEKYKFQEVTFEWIPNCPTTQDGSIIMFPSYDPEDNDFLTSDRDSRIRLAMSRRGSIFFNVISHGRVLFKGDKDSLQWYFNSSSEDPRTETQGLFYIMAASTYTPPDGVSTTRTLGNIIMHYKVTGISRTQTDIVLPVSNITTTISTTFTLAISNLAADTLIAFNSGILMAANSTKFNNFYVIRFIKGLIDATVPTSVIGYSADCFTDFNIGATGTILYGCTDKDGGGVYLFTKLSNAIMKDTSRAIMKRSAATGANTCSCICNIQGYNMDSSHLQLLLSQEPTSIPKTHINCNEEEESEKEEPTFDNHYYGMITPNGISPRRKSELTIKNTYKP